MRAKYITAVRWRSQTMRFGVILVCLMFATQGDTQGHRQMSLQSKLALALEGTSASAVVLRLRDGAVLARRGGDEAATPGSMIKPLLLSWALQHGIIQPDTKVFCRRSLRVGTQQLPCTHPPDQTTFTAQSALAESCNTYFAALGTRLRGSDLEDALHATHLPHTNADNDTPDQRELTTLGLRGVTATPMQLATSYRDLLLHENPNGPVMRGLTDSVLFGMADPARVEGVALLGKTGTAADAKATWTHGWFAGAVPGNMVIVIYLPHGNGGDAARLAGTFVRAAVSELKQ